MKGLPSAGSKKAVGWFALFVQLGARTLQMLLAPLLSSASQHPTHTCMCTPTYFFFWFCFFFFFWNRISLSFPGWFWIRCVVQHLYTYDAPVSASQVDGITGLYHQAQHRHVFVLKRLLYVMRTSGEWGWERDYLVILCCLVKKKKLGFVVSLFGEG